MKKLNRQFLHSSVAGFRALTGLLLGLTGISLALFATAKPNVNTRTQQQNNIIVSSSDPLVPVGFDCSRISQLGIDKQMNGRAAAIMIACGAAPGGEELVLDAPSKPTIDQAATFGGSDVDLITGTETSPNVTQSTTFAAGNPDNPLQIVIGYNDSRGRNATSINISGASVSTDGGSTFTRLTTANGQSPFDKTFGDPVVLYNRPSSTWFTVWLDSACGGQGLGGYKSTTPSDPNSWTHFCVHSGSSDDRPSGWTDHNLSSPFFGRMYVSWNDYNNSGPPISVVRSTDNGATWSSPVNLSIPTGAGLVRNVQITGDKVTGDLYVAGMDENSGNGCTFGCGSTRRNILYRSTDGGATFTNTYTGPTFVGPCRSSSGFFCTMYDSPAYWRHQGWGEPAAFNNVVNLVYAQKDGTDPGNVYCIRSTDSGVTFSAPFQLNSNTDSTKAQWEPNLSVSDAGTLFATWYDETPRVAASCQPSSPGTPCYQIHSRKSNDNGVTWLADDTFSDVASPLPLQPDPGIGPTYVSDYDYASSVGNLHLSGWVDGRVTIAGASQQDAFADKEFVGFSVTNTDPACRSLVSSQPVDFVVNLSDPVDPTTVQATDFSVNGMAANSFVLSNANSTITFHFNTSPVTAQGTQTMDISAGAFNRASDNQPNFPFDCTFCFAVAPLQVTTTNPPVGGTFSPAAPGDYQYDVNFNQAVDPSSVDVSDLTLTGNAGGSVTGFQLVNGNTTVRFTLHFKFGGSATASISAGSITANFCNTNAAFTGTYTVEGCPAQNQYDIQQIGDSIVPGTTDTGNHGDDQVTTIALPFPYTLYDQTFTSVNLSSNGSAQFTTTDTAFTNQCLPWLSHNYTIFPYWDDQFLVSSGFGIFTSVSGVAPNRIFNIEWRAQYFPGTGSANYELRLYEGQTRFDVLYGTITNGNTSATAGVQKDDSNFNQYFCNGAGGAASGGQSYTLQTCCPQVLTATVNDSVTGTGINQWDYTSGGWFYYSNPGFTTAYQHDEHYAPGTGTMAHFRFHGNQVKIYTVKEPVGGNIRYTLDGDTGGAQIINNYSPTQVGNSLSYTSPMVNDGDHDLVVEVLGTHGPGTSNTITVDKAEVYAANCAPVQALGATINDNTTGTGNNQFDYTSGGWSYYTANNFNTAFQKDEHYAFTTGVFALFRFNGTQVKIYTVKEPAGGKIRYTLDNGVDVQDIDNYSPTQVGNTLSYTSPVVAAGDHVLKIEVLGMHDMGSSNTITVDKAEVYVPAAGPPTLTATVNDSVTGTGTNQFDYGASGWFYYSNPGFTTAFQMDEHYAFTTGVMAHFRFNGTQVKIYTVKEPAGGFIRYILDGGVDNQLISNYSATQIGNTLSYTSPIVSPGDHDLVIQVNGTHEPSASSNTITVDKAEVYSGP